MTADNRLIRGALVASFALFIVFGLPDGVFGTAWPDVRDDFGRTDNGLGFIVLCISVGYGLGSVSSGSITQRLGLGSTLPLAMTAAVAALAAIAAAPSWWIAGAGYAALGLTWGIGDAGVNAWMALTQGPRQMGLLHACYGVGAVLGPLLATSLITNGASWRAAYAVCAILTAAAVGALTLARHGFAAAPITPQIATPTERSPAANRLLTLMVLWFSIYVGVEVAVGSWGFTLLTEGRGESEVTAAILTAAFWGGLMLGRFGLALLGNRLHPEQTMRGSTAIAMVATLTFWIDPPVIGRLSLPVIGLALSMMFPVAIGRTAVYLGSERATGAVGYQLGASTVGAAALPAVIGLVADRDGVEWAAPIIVAAVLIMGALWIAVERFGQPSGVVTAPAADDTPAPRRA